MTNVMVQVLKTNRNFVSNIQHIFEPVMVKLKQYFTRVNHVEFISNSDIDLFTVSDDDDVIDFIKDFKFEIGVQAYSNVGHMATFKVDVGNTSVTPDEFVGNEIHFNLTGEKQPIVTQEESDVVDTSLSDDDSFLNLITDKMKDFTFESKDSNDSTSSSDESNDEDNDTSEDESEIEEEMTTKYAETRTYCKPNQIHFGSNAMITRPTISRILQLGGARKRKIIKQDKGDRMKSKGTKNTDNKYKNAPHFYQGTQIDSVYLVKLK